MIVNEAEGVPCLDVLSREWRRDSIGRTTAGAPRREALLREFFASGMSQAAFARRNGMTYSTFAGWVRKRRRESDAYTTDRHRMPADEASPVFRELRIEAAPAPPAGPSGLTVVFPGGVEVRGCDAATVVALVKALRGAR